MVKSRDPRSILAESKETTRHHARERADEGPDRFTFRGPKSTNYLSLGPARSRRPPLRTADRTNGRAEGPRHRPEHRVAHRRAAWRPTVGPERRFRQEACFAVELVPASDAASVAVSGPPAVAGAAARRGRLLLVEDHEGTGGLLANALAGHGYDVTLVP